LLPFKKKPGLDGFGRWLPVLFTLSLTPMSGVWPALNVLFPALLIPQLLFSMVEEKLCRFKRSFTITNIPLFIMVALVETKKLDEPLVCKHHLLLLLKYILFI
jgi:hypothetical protein